MTRGVKAAPLSAIKIDLIKSYSKLYQSHSHHSIRFFTHLLQSAVCSHYHCSVVHAVVLMMVAL